MTVEQQEEGGEPSCPSSGRLVGLDLGDVRIGVAVSDSRQRLASPRTVLRRGEGPGSDLERIAALIEEEHGAGVVVGLPRSLSGALGPAARRALAEVERLRRVLPVPVVTIDERFSTVEAERRRREAGGARRGSAIDDAAAAVLLQAYLDGAEGRSR